MKHHFFGKQFRWEIKNGEFLLMAVKFFQVIQKSNRVVLGERPCLLMKFLRVRFQLQSGLTRLWRHRVTYAILPCRVCCFPATPTTFQQRQSFPTSSNSGVHMQPAALVGRPKRPCSPKGPKMGNSTKCWESCWGKYKREQW